MLKNYLVIGIGILILIGLVIFVVAGFPPEGYRGGCNGVATTCYDITNDALCGGQNGCDYYLGQCAGTPTIDCSSILDQPSCDFYSPLCGWVGYCESTGSCEMVMDDSICMGSGCDWHCGGVENPCTDYHATPGTCGETVEEVQLGCYWDDCMYRGGGNWIIDVGDYCVYENNINLGGSYGIIFTDGYLNRSGNATFYGNVTNLRNISIEFNSTNTNNFTINFRGNLNPTG